MCFQTVDYEKTNSKINDNRARVGYKFYTLKKHKKYHFLNGFWAPRRWYQYNEFTDGFYIIECPKTKQEKNRLITYAKSNYYILCKVLYRQHICYGTQYGFNCLTAEYLKIVKEVVDKSGRIRAKI